NLCVFIMLTSLPQPVIFAHRGASAHAPENTLAAFELALAQNADAIELDVKLSADGHVVVIHDPTVDRTTGSHGRVKDLSLTQMRSLDAGRFFSEKYRGEQIPTLEEVFEAVGKRTFINVELTNYNTPRDQLVETVCMLVTKFGLQKHVMFSSFFALNLSKARAYLPGVPRGLLAFNGFLGAWARSFGFAFGRYQALHPFLKDVTSQQVQRVHRLNRRIHVWTVNAADDMRSLFHWGVDAIFTDDPWLAVQVRSESK
ncbi:MAG TPA: glycerophosphodiester phosphodiesterase family protein, partial [Anaerolineales bacterium]|nr:glycerophosphodiester phosphodiesterase family protein [Anaerolineales bacterium]